MSQGGAKHIVMVDEHLDRGAELVAAETLRQTDQDGLPEAVPGRSLLHHGVHDRCELHGADPAAGQFGDRLRPHLGRDRGQRGNGLALEHISCAEADPAGLRA